MSDEMFARHKKTGRWLFERLAASEPEMMEAHMTWKGQHREVDWKICLWGLGSMCDGNGMWNYYIYLREQQIGPERFAPLWLEPQWKTLGSKREHKTFHYYVPPFTELEMHGGITFYERHGGDGHVPRCVEIGCDFGHHWDAEAGYPYSLQTVKREAAASIDRLHDLFPDMYVRCNWDGTYHPRSEMLTNKNGHLVWSGNREAVPAEWNWFPMETEPVRTTTGK